MALRLLMLSPVFEVPPEIVREDVAEACAIVEYETVEELAQKIHEAATALTEQLALTEQG